MHSGHSWYILHHYMMAQCLYIRIWRNTDSHRIRYQTWRCLWNLIWFWFTHSFTIKLKHGANIREIYDIAKIFPVFNTSMSHRIHRFTQISLRPGRPGIWKGHADFADDADFFDLFGQIHTDYLRTYAVPLVGDRNLRGWLRVLTQ